MSGAKLETERLILRPWKKNKADAKELYRYAKNPKVGPIAGWPVHRDAGHSLQIIREVLCTPGLFAIVLKETGKPIGCVGLTYGATGRKYLKADEAELGYWLGEPYWGMGLAAEASRRMIRYAFEELGMTKVWAAYYEGNDRSRLLQERLGFTYHHSVKEEYVAQLSEVRTEHFCCLDRTVWEKPQQL